jgi:hypothetical protein
VADCSINDGAGRNNHCPYYLLTDSKKKNSLNRIIRSKRHTIYANRGIF